MRAPRSLGFFDLRVMGPPDSPKWLEGDLDQCWCGSAMSPMQNHEWRWMALVMLVRPCNF